MGPSPVQQPVVIQTPVQKARAHIQKKLESIFLGNVERKFYNRILTSNILEIDRINDVFKRIFIDLMNGIIRFESKSMFKQYEMENLKKLFQQRKYNSMIETAYQSMIIFNSLNQIKNQLLDFDKFKKFIYNQVSIHLLSL